MSPDPDTPIYLDHHATTPVADEVLSVMQPYFTDHFGNPASDDHIFGANASQGVEDARQQIADAINSRKEEVIFTSGATESDNLAIRGAAEYAVNNGHGNHIITSVIEHEAVLEVCEALENDGFEVTYLPVNDDGRVRPTDVEDAITDDTVIVSVMAANNEIGTIQPLDEIGTIAKENQVLFHTDAVQAAGYVSLDVKELGIDLMSLSSHKIYGPKGVGALYVRRRNPKVKLEPLIRGGGHERGWRSGTLNVPAIVGFGEAMDQAYREQAARTSHVDELSSYMIDRFQDELDAVVLNGSSEHRLPNNGNLSFIGVENKGLVQNLQPEIAVSAGSACTTGKVEASHVLESISDEEDRWHSAIRFGLGKDNTHEEITYATDQVIQGVNRLRKLNF